MDAGMRLRKGEPLAYYRITDKRLGEKSTPEECFFICAP